MKVILKLLLNEARNWFIDYNWCHNDDHQGNPKPPSLFHSFYRAIFWPIPDQQPQPCWCCASFRGIIYGAVLGWVMCEFKRATVIGLGVIVSAIILMICRRTYLAWQETKNQAELDKINMDRGDYDV